MADKSKNQLWPYKKALALLAIPLVWLFFISLFISGYKLDMWQNNMADSTVIVVAIISILPLLLVVLDFLVLKKAIIDTKWIKFDFSNLAGDVQDGRQIAFRLPENAGIPGAIVSDTSVMSITGTLNIGSAHQIVVANLKSGNAWWVTRLLALCAGAVRIGSPEIIVFLGKKENTLDHFLGWGKPGALLKAILHDKPEYKIRYDKAALLTKQFLSYKQLLHTVPAPAMPADISRYISDPEYKKRNEEVAEFILLDQLGNVMNTSGSLEIPPDRLTISRLNELFDHCLYRDFINLDSSGEDQVAQLLKSKANYLALVKDDQYTGIMEKSFGESLVLKKLAQPSEDDN